MKIVIKACILAIFIYGFLPDRYLHAEEAEWGNISAETYLNPQTPKIRVMEVYGSFAIQEGGLLVPSVQRSPMSLRVLAGVNPFKLNINSLGGRILHGPFISLPFSIEIGYLEDINQLAPAIGWQFSARPSKDWKWLAGIQLSFVIPEKVLIGPGLQLGFVYYLLAGLGIFAELNIDMYFGTDKSALTTGGSAGLLFSFEHYKLNKQPK